jgi:hypothetical protein
MLQTGKNPFAFARSNMEGNSDGSTPRHYSPVGTVRIVKNVSEGKLRATACAEAELTPEPKMFAVQKFARLHALFRRNV